MKRKKLGFLWFYYSNGGDSENSLIITKVKDSDLFENDGKEGGGCHNHNHDVVFLLARIKNLDALCFLCFSLSLSCLDHYEFHIPTTTCLPILDFFTISTACIHVITPAFDFFLFYSFVMHHKFRFDFIYIYILTIVNCKCNFE